jgi:hypothetical protein
MECYDAGAESNRRATCFWINFCGADFMVKKRTVLSVLVVLALGLAAEARATLITAVPYGPNRNDSSFLVGFKFQVGSSNVSVTKLGFIDAGANGLLSTHDVGIFQSVDQANLTNPTPSTSDVLVGSATIPSGLSAPLGALNFRYVDVTPFTLTANTMYWLVAVTVGGGDLWFDQSFAVSSNLTFDSSLFTVLPDTGDPWYATDVRTDSSTSLSQWGTGNQYGYSTGGIGGAPYNAANFEAVAVPTPEPNSFCLLLLGAMLMSRRVRSRFNL